MATRLLAVALLALVLSASVDARRGGVRSLKAGRNKCISWIDEDVPNKGFYQNQRTPSSATPNLFESLSYAELKAVKDFLFAQRELNFTLMNEDTHPMDNVIFSVELNIPTKTSALRHLDGGGAAPPRTAMARVHMGRRSPPVALELEVGPLPRPTYYKVVSTQHWHMRQISTPEYNRAEELVGEALATLEPYMQSVFGGYSYAEDCEKCIWWNNNQPYGDANKRTFWLWTTADRESIYANILDVQFHMDMSGYDSSKWKIASFVTNNISFPSAQAIIDEWATPGSRLHSRKFQLPTGEDELLSSFAKRPGPGRPEPDPRLGRPPRGPMLVNTDGRRFTIDRNVISYMGWTMQVAISPSKGPAYFDLKFKGKRIAYEIMLQEALAQYGGQDPGSRSTLYWDSHWGVGEHYELLAGVDCPTGAAFLNTAMLWGSEGPEQFYNSICVYETMFHVPQQRHATNMEEGSFAYHAAIQNYALVVRGISTAYNYDYTYDLYLGIDGVITWSSTPTGYDQSQVYLSKDGSEEPAYGYQLYHNLYGALHNHMYHVKVDLDIEGTSNQVSGKTLTNVCEASPWDGAYRCSAKVVHQVLQKEAGLVNDASKPTYWVVQSSTAKNKWGNNKGYRIVPNGQIAQLAPRSWPTMNAISWSYYQLAFTRQKDSEPISASVYDGQMPATPVVQFDKFINDEPLVGTDIVSWVTLGAWHIPVAEDSPTTPSLATTSFKLVPFNYFDENGANDSNDQTYVRMDPSGESKPTEERFGLPRDFGCKPNIPNVKYKGLPF